MSFDGDFDLQKIKDKKVVAAVIAGGLVAVAIIAYFALHKPSISNNLGESSAQTISTSVGTSEDSRTLGYPDARKIVRASNSVLYAAYRAKSQDKKDSYQIFVAKSTDNGKSWKLANSSDPISDADEGFNQRVPSILYADKTLYVTWYGANSKALTDKNHQILFSKSSNGGKTFSAPKNIYFVDGYYGEDTWQEHPVISKNQGRLFITWEGKDSSHPLQQIKLSISDNNGESWQTPLNINSDKARTFSRPSILVTENKLWMFCYSGLNDGSNSSVYSSQSSDNGRTWSQWQTLSSDNKDSRHISSVADANGNIYVAYRVYSGNTSSIAYRIYGPTHQNWSSQTTIPKSKSGQFFPSLAYVSGKVYLAFSVEDDTKAKPPKEDLNDTASSVLLAYNPSTQSFSQQITSLTGGWLNLNRSGTHLEGVLAKPAGDGKYDIQYYQWNTNKL